MLQVDITRGTAVYFIHPKTDNVSCGTVKNMIAQFDKRVFVVIAVSQTDCSQPEITINVPLEHVFMNQDDAKSEHSRYMANIHDYTNQMKTPSDILNFMAKHNVKKNLAAAKAVKAATDKILDICPDKLKF